MLWIKNFPDCHKIQQFWIHINIKYDDFLSKFQQYETISIKKFQEKNEIGHLSQEPTHPTYLIFDKNIAKKTAFYNFLMHEISHDMKNVHKISENMCKKAFIALIKKRFAPT